MINKDTKVCISISKNAGNFGCNMHNALFKKHDLNFIYKSFSVDDLDGAVMAIKALKIRGAGVSMPYKVEVISLLNKVSREVVEIGSVNTIVNEKNVLTGYNTDAYSSETLLREKMAESNIKNLVILGNGGYSKAVLYSAKKLEMEVCKITRSDWNKIKDLRNLIVFNCTPVRNLEKIIHESCIFIDCDTNTETGSRLATLQGEKQFELYTGIEL